MPVPNPVNFGEPISASGTNDLYAEVRALSNLRGTGGITVSRNVAGYSIGFAGQSPPFLARIKTEGPESEADYTDNRYWITPAEVSNSSGAATVLVTTADVDAESYLSEIITATNFAEDGTHLLREDDTVLVFKDSDKSTPAKDRYYFWAATANAVVVSVTANAAGGGKYTGTIAGGSSTAAASGTLAMGEGLTVGDACLILHTPEDGKPTHWIKLGSYAAGVVVGWTDEETPKRIVVIDNAEYRTASPNSLDDGSGTTAGVKSWDRNAATAGDVYGDGPVTETYVSRVVWDATANALKQYVKTRTIDAGGNVVSISAETEETIDTAEDCEAE